MDNIVYGDPKVITEALLDHIKTIDGQLKEHSDFAVAYSELKRITEQFLMAQDKYLQDMQEAER